MLAQDLGSRLARTRLGIAPDSSIPQMVLSQFSLVSWDHEKKPGFMWKLSDLMWHDLSEGKVVSMDGFRVADSEVVAVVRRDELLTLVPKGSWVMKPGAQLNAGMDAGELELVWINLKPIMFKFYMKDLQLQNSHRSLHAEVSLRISDPARLVVELVVGQDKSSSDSIKHRIFSELFAFMKSEASSCNPNDPSWQSHLEQESRAMLERHVSNLGFSLTDFRILEEPSATSSSQKEAKKSRRGEMRQTSKSRLSRTQLIKSVPSAVTSGSSRPRTVRSSGVAIQMLEWATAPKRWIPKRLRGEARCDGCGAHTDALGQCCVSCRSLRKCGLCETCYSKRRRCAFVLRLPEPTTSQRTTGDKIPQRAVARSEKTLRLVTVT